MKPTNTPSLSAPLKAIALTIIGLLLAFACFLPMAIPPRAAATDADLNAGPTHWASLLTNATVCVTNATTNTSYTTPKFFLRQTRGVSIIAKLNTTNTAADDAITFTFQASHDGTNWITRTPYTFAPALNGTTTVIAHTNWGVPILDNLAYMRLYSIATAGTNTLWVSNLWYSTGN
jgi:hypothetical protein